MHGIIHHKLTHCPLVVRAPSFFFGALAMLSYIYYQHHITSSFFHIIIFFRILHSPHYSKQILISTFIYLLTLLTFPYFQGFPPLKILYMYPFPLFLPLWDNYKGKFIIQLFNRCLPLYQEVLRKSALLPL